MTPPLIKPPALSGIPSRLVSAFGTRPDLAATEGRGYVSYLNFLDWRARTRAFASITTYDVRAGFTLSTAAGPEPVSGLRVTSGFFRTLGVVPVLGREFQSGEEDRLLLSVMLAYSAWQTHSAVAPMSWDASSHCRASRTVVIGVLPREFHFAMADHADFWAAIQGPQPCWEVRTCRSLETVARLADGVSVQVASLESRTPSCRSSWRSIRTPLSKRRS